MYCIYETINNINNKTYIGQHSYDNSPDEDNYLGSGVLILKAISKYGKENFTKKIICCGIQSQDEINRLEIFYIKEGRKAGKCQYNIADGGNKPPSRLNVPHTYETRKKISEHNAHFSHSKDWRLKMSKLMQGDNNPSRKYGSHNKGKKMSEEQKKKLSESHKGIPSKFKGKHISASTQEKLNKEVECYHIYKKQHSGISWNEFRKLYKENGITLICEGGSV